MGEILFYNFARSIIESPLGSQDPVVFIAGLLTPKSGLRQGQILRSIGKAFHSLISLQHSFDFVHPWM